MPSQSQPISRNRRATWSQRLARAALAGAAVLLLVLGLGGPQSPVIDTLTVFTGHILGCAAFAAWAVYRQRGELAVLVMGAMAVILGHAALGLGSRFDGLRHADPLPALGAFRIVTLNTWHEHPDLDRLERFLVEVRADAVVLTEVGPPKLELLGRLKRIYPFQSHCADRWYCAVAVLSRHPIEAAFADRRGAHEPPVAQARLKVATIDGGVLTIVGTHLHRPTRNPWLHDIHRKQISVLARRAAGPLVLAGDFNAGPWSASFRAIVRETGLVRTPGLLPTWPASPVGLPQFAFDHVLTPAAARILSTRLGPNVGSDHYPVIVDLLLPPPRASTAAAPLGLAP